MVAAPDPEMLASALGRALGDGLRVEGLKRVSGGASRETWLFDATAPDGSPYPLVLRRDPGAHAGQSARATEYTLLSATAAAGVAVPRPVMLLEPADGLGSGFVMERIEGETIPRRILRDAEYEQARPLLAAQCGTIAAAIHATDTAALPALPMLGAAEQIDQFRGLLDTIGEPHPALELGLRWLGERLPPPPPAPRLVHGDFRLGNFIVDADGVRSVLDWELSHLGDPIEDLGWLCVRSWRFGVDDHVVGGFGHLDALLDAYATEGTDRPDPEVVHYWMVFGTLKWGAMTVLQGFAHLQGAVRSVELATLGRRVVEMEWDLLDSLDGELVMPDDRPTAAELVDAVTEFLERDIQPALEGRLGFHTRVAVNALRIVKREMEIGPQLDETRRTGLRALLGARATAAASSRDLELDLVRQIRAGALDERRPELMAYLRATLRLQLAIVHPGYERQETTGP